METENNTQLNSDAAKPASGKPASGKPASGKPAPGKPAPGRRDIFLAFLKSHLIQAGWNYERMQNLGLAYSLEGYLRAIGKPDAVKKHLEFFNTSPYMAPGMIGVLMKMEHDGDDIEEMKSFKRNMMGPLGALGDTLFWGALRPFCSGGAAVIALGGVVFAPVIGFVVYNIIALWMRFIGFYYGWTEKSEMLSRLISINFSKSNLYLGAALILGLSFGFRKVLMLGSGGLPELFMGLALVVGTSVAVKKGAEPQVILVAAAVVSIASSYFLG